MKHTDHLPTELRIKVNYLRNFRVQVLNDVPDGYICVILASPDLSIGCGSVYGPDGLDKAIAEAEEMYPEIAGMLKKQLTLF